MLEQLPSEVRLIAAISRLIDIHQSRREAGGAYIPDIPEKAGFHLFLAISIINCLHEIELDRGAGYCPFIELIGRLRKQVPGVTDADIEYSIINLRQGREIHFGVGAHDGTVTYARTWDTTPLLDVQEGLSQIQLTENARLLLRVSSLRDSWLYSDLDADRLVKAIERGQFQDVPAFCRAMTLDVAAKSKQLSGVLERPSLAELRNILIAEGSSIAESLNVAAVTVGHAIDLIFSDRTRAQFNVWTASMGANQNFYLGNLQADLELVLQNVESLSRRFLQFIELAQKVRNEGGQAIRFLTIADALVTRGNSDSIFRVEHLLHDLITWGVSTQVFHPSVLSGEADLRGDLTPTQPGLHGFTVDPALAGVSSRFMDCLERNRELVLEQLEKGPVSFSEMVQLTNFSLLEGESPLDFFGVYASPKLLSSDMEKIVVGFTDLIADFPMADRQVSGSDPLMFIERTL